MNSSDDKLSQNVFGNSLRHKRRLNRAVKSLQATATTTRDVFSNSGGGSSSSSSKRRDGGSCGATAACKCLIATQSRILPTDSMCVNSAQSTPRSLTTFLTRLFTANVFTVRCRPRSVDHARRKQNEYKLIKTLQN